MYNKVVSIVTAIKQVSPFSMDLYANVVFANKKLNMRSALSARSCYRACYGSRSQQAGCKNFYQQQNERIAVIYMEAAKDVQSLLPESAVSRC
jgi:hypothetical protein